MRLHARKSLSGLEGAIDKNVNVTGNSVEDSERKEERYREPVYHLGEDIHHHE